ncbi:hypothetical protein OSB04_002617 [Centaurea solstitialis]|uniref:Uncharacterized protein n=1 Tax=Centaurea solstitialis TaxID=347529 RepID=A0AA38U3T2_9ASTR|nr:hypothetical protein OSB04_002617 [Centaurea solstitialis]
MLLLEEQRLTHPCMVQASDVDHSSSSTALFTDNSSLGTNQNRNQPHNSKCDNRTPDRRLPSLEYRLSHPILGHTTPSLMGCHHRRPALLLVLKSPLITPASRVASKIVASSHKKAFSTLHHRHNKLLWLAHHRLCPFHGVGFLKLVLIKPLVRKQLSTLLLSTIQRMIRGTWILEQHHTLPLTQLGCEIKSFQCGHRGLLHLPFHLTNLFLMIILLFHAYSPLLPPSSSIRTSAYLRHSVSQQCPSSPYPHVVVPQPHTTAINPYVTTQANAPPSTPSHQ